MHIKSIEPNSIAIYDLPKKPDTPGGMVFCSWGGCDVDCATPPGRDCKSFSGVVVELCRVEERSSSRL
jgi:hypothetical protein